MKIGSHFLKSGPCLMAWFFLLFSCLYTLCLRSNDDLRYSGGNPCQIVVMVAVFRCTPTLLRHPPLKGGFSLSKGLGDVILHEILDCHRMIRSSIESSIFGLGYALDLQPQASTVQMESEMQ
ncbi:hypothetical protein MRB53_001874 [Persea americana]|uniref:Uncharacterized protein n=1 Tax=Persea americana TaxID=3435 RepID=A0ACC2MSZ1_PERAE|nr:hypothetical protein MRB53_001874 [Persea americana]